jgi:acyl-CoA thioesterase FadM
VTGETAAARPSPLRRDAFVRFVPITTRWSDNDVYGHLNNVVYYSCFDTAVNALLVEAGLLDPASSGVVGLVVESNCSFFSSLAFPDAIEVGVTVEALGRSSVRGQRRRAGALHARLCRTEKPAPHADSTRASAIDGEFETACMTLKKPWVVFELEICSCVLDVSLA